MHHQLPHTAVLVFIREEQEEARLKSFREGLSFRASLQVVRAFNQHIKKITRQSKLPTIFVKGTQQVGNTFGERFTNAFQAAFEAGYHQVIAIGNDCLSLTAAQLRTMATALEGGTALVLGPAKDGGAYAVGIQRAAFCKDQFAQLPWQTGQDCEALIHYIEGLEKTWFCLPVAIDVDDAVSLQQAITYLSTTARLYRLLKCILHATTVQSSRPIAFVSNHLVLTAFLRAPPVAI